MIFYTGKGNNRRRLSVGSISAKFQYWKSDGNFLPIELVDILDDNTLSTRSVELEDETDDEIE